MSWRVCIPSLTKQRTKGENLYSQSKSSIIEKLSIMFASWNEIPADYIKSQAKT